MAMRLDYVVRETSNNPLRNLLLTVASIITFGVSLGHSWRRPVVCGRC